jgi:hypothetical protein
MKRILSAVLLMGLLAGALPSYAIAPVYSHTQKQPSKHSKFKAFLLKLNPVRQPDARQFVIRDNWGSSPSVVSISDPELKGNNLSTGAKVGIGVGCALGAGIVGSILAALAGID